MQAELDLLAQLRDIHLPDAIAWWPPAPGWFILAFLFVLIGTSLVYLGYRRYRRQHVKRFALRRLQYLQTQYQQMHQGKEIIIELSILLRRVALAYFPRQEIAGLHGKSWLSFLQLQSEDCDFEHDGLLLLSAPYQAQIDEDLLPLFVLCRCWIGQRN